MPLPWPLLKTSKTFSPKHLGRALLDLVFPGQCLGCQARLETTGQALDQVFCPVCRPQIGWLCPPFCAICGEPGGNCPGHAAPGHLNGVWARAWHQGLLARVIGQYKYEKQIQHGARLAALLLAESPDWLGENFELLVPVPLHPRRLRQRGFNQALLLAKSLKQSGLRSDLLRRVQHRPPQVNLNRAERQKNVKGIFALNPRYKVEGRSVLLLDDVWTTGATMRECARVLAQAGAARVGALTLTRAPLDEGKGG